MRAYIPPNIGSLGGVFAGLFKKRNAAEAGIFAAISLLLLKGIAKRIGAALAFIFGLSVILPISVLLLIGIKGRSVVSIALDLIIYQRTKALLLIQPPKVISHDSKKN